ncbi:MAG: tRNA lysidine(34) synthetase TilS [Pseudobdellovibrionaceae bacterium]
MRISPEEKWIVAVSGGADSIVLVELLRTWRKLLKAELIIAHVHHGLGRSKKQNAFRNKAQKLVEQVAEKNDFSFLTNSPLKTADESEAGMRDFRYRLLEAWCAGNGCAGIVLAHHRDDLLETRLIRLLRGTGVSGLTGMKVRTGKKFRPLLDLSRKEIELYAEKRGLKFINDPSNEDAGSLRNWLRHEWIPALEKRRPGATRSLARSLEILARKPQTQRRIDLNVGLRRDSLDEETLAQYLRQLGCSNYGRSHVQEILKRIDTRRKNLTFEMLGFVFKVTPDLLLASRV